MPYSPQSAIFQLSARWSPILLVALALGVFIGIWSKNWFNYPSEVAPNQVARHRRAHAVFHWINAIGFVLCIVSAVILFKWVGNLGELLTYSLHFFGATLIMLAIGAVATRAWVREPGQHKIHITNQDMKELRFELLCYLGLAGKHGILGFGKRTRDTKFQPPQGLKPQKYLATERILSYPVWVVLVALIGVTGIIKVLRYVTGMPASVLYFATKVHDITAILIMIMILVHAGAVILVKTNWPLLKSMFSLTIPKDFGKDD